MMKGIWFLVLFSFQNEFLETKTSKIELEETKGLLEPLPVEPTSELEVFPSTELNFSPDLIVTTISQQLCEGTEVTLFYERKKDIDMRYVQDTITSLWRIVFSLIFILILLVFLIAYITSLILKHNVNKRLPKKRRFADTNNFPTEKNFPSYFPIIHGPKSVNFLKELDPIYDYPCSLQSDYERV